MRPEPRRPSEAEARGDPGAALPGGKVHFGFRDGIAPLSAAPFAWPPATDSTPARIVFVGPAPTAASGGGGLFGIFSALRPSAPPSGLFMANLEASGLQDAQPRRLGTAINTFGLVWRSESALLGFALGCWAWLLRHQPPAIQYRDKVVTQGGISGTIIALRDEFVHLRVPPDNIKLEISRNAVVSVVNPEQPAKT